VFAAVDNNASPQAGRLFRGVSEGTRTPDRLDHNQELYQLSYAHHGIGASLAAVLAGG
jgi:hypothetical protein